MNDKANAACQAGRLHGKGHGSPIQDRLWQTVREAESFTTAQAADKAGASKVYARRYVAALWDGGYLMSIAESPEFEYRLVKDTGELAPLLEKDGSTSARVRDARFPS